MASSLFTGVTGLRVHQEMLDVVGNNLANTNTTGFKAQRIRFSDLVYQTFTQASGATANLGGWYLANHATLPLTRTISQGEMAGRPSSLQLRIDASRNVFVAGDVIELGRGYIELE